jgi:branched-chain amino acid transport system substrate-binding protein
MWAWPDPGFGAAGLARRIVRHPFGRVPTSQGDLMSKFEVRGLAGAAGLVGTLVAASVPAMAQTQEPVRIGFLSTQSGGPVAGLSTEKRQGWELALKQLGGKLGGVPVEVFYADDANNPGMGKQSYERLVKQNKIDVLTGIVTTPVIFSLASAVAQDKVIFLNSNVTERALGGDKCSPYFFTTGWHVDGINESMGRLLKAQGRRKVFVMGGQWPAGREHITAFKRGYGDALAGEVYFKMGQIDFSAEIAQMRAAEPDAIYSFAFGPHSVNFMKQYAQAGLKRIPLYGPSPLADEGTIPASGEAALEVVSSGHWNDDLTHDANRKFVAAYVAEYKKDPTMFSEQGYTTALVLDAALRAAGGNVRDHAALRKALLSVKLETPRGPLSLATDGSPVHNVYLRKVGKNAKGEITNLTQRTIGTAVAPDNAGECRL